MSNPRYMPVVPPAMPRHPTCVGDHRRPSARTKFSDPKGRSYDRSPACSADLGIGEMERKGPIVDVHELASFDARPGPALVRIPARLAYATDHDPESAGSSNVTGIQDVFRWIWSKLAAWLVGTDDAVPVDQPEWNLRARRTRVPGDRATDGPSREPLPRANRQAVDNTGTRLSRPSARRARADRSPRPAYFSSS